MIAILAVDPSAAAVYWPPAAALPAGTHLLAAQERAVQIGWVAYEQQQEELTVTALQAPDTALADGLLRAALARALDTGARRVTVARAVGATVPSALGLTETATGWVGMIAEVFARGCPSASSRPDD